VQAGWTGSLGGTESSARRACRGHAPAVGGGAPAVGGGTRLPAAGRACDRAGSQPTGVGAANLQGGQIPPALCRIFCPNRSAPARRRPRHTAPTPATAARAQPSGSRRAKRGGSPPAEARRLRAVRGAAAPHRPKRGGSPRARRGGSPPAEAWRLPAGRSAVAPRRRTRHRRQRDRTGPAPAANRVIDSGLPQRARRPEMKGLSPRNAVQLRQSGIGRRSEDGLPTSRSTSCDLAPN
jgi:hypothetical protein